MAAAKPGILGDPAKDAYAVTPADGTDLPQGLCTAISVNVAGIVRVYVGPSSTTALDIYIAAGVPYPLQVRRVLSAGTTATGIVALY